MLNERISNAIKRRTIPQLLIKMNKATHVEDIKRYEDQMITSLISSAGIVGAILNLIFRLIWNDPLSDIFLTSALLILFSFSMDQIVLKVKDNGLRVHLLSLCVVGILITISLSYYDRIGIIIYTAIFLLLLVSIIRIDKVMFSFVGVTGVGINIVLFINHIDEVIILDKLFYFTQSSLFMVLFIVGFLWNKIYQDRFLKSHNQFIETVGQKEELSQLYEEIMATEEELRMQNERLHEYNSEIKANENKLNFMAYNDALTELPNRKMIIEKLNFLIEISKENNKKFAVVFVDLDGFKKINDTMGHHIGDEYLKEVGVRLKSCIKETDTIGRFGGDEFAVIIQNTIKEDKLYEYVNCLRENLCKPFEIDGYKIHASASFGISIFPDDATVVIDLIKTADAAMYKAKEKGKNNIQFFRKEMKEEILLKIELENELIEALANDEFFLVYQPQVELESNNIEGFEALLRWNSPKRGVVSPLEFIPVLEDMGLINQVGDWVLVESCRKINELKVTHGVGYYVSVNVSGHQIKDINFVRRVEEVIKEFNIDPNLLELEITESVFIHDIKEAVTKINSLKDLGVSIALDDFGTGYSSLSYLRMLPIDVLKIDKSFIWDLEKGDKERKIVGSIIDLVHEMDISVVAEGVETQYQLDYLDEEECDHIQGYLISKPVGDIELDHLIGKHTVNSVSVK